MADEPTLPRLSPSISWNAQTERFSNNPKKRRYNFKSHSVAPPSWSNSSDPAVFSSDDDPGLDNYIEGRRKKRYVGSWFHQQPASSDSATGEPRPALRGKRTFKRDLDSGVWMGSDSTDGDESIMIPELPTQSRLPQLNRTPVRRRNVISSEELEARERIQQCLDSGNEYIDLSMMGLKALSDATIQPLSEFSCIPIVAEGVPFEQKDPALQLYLYRNPLQRLPGAIFDLQLLTVLSLRGCRLRELPPAIGRLRNLQVLNLAQNLLSFLPAELLDLMAAPAALRELLLQGNHFFQATDLPRPKDLENLGDELDGSELSGAWNPGSDGVAARFFARSPVHYLDSSGFSHSEFRLDYEAVIVPTERKEDRENASLISPPSSAPYQSKSAARTVQSAQGGRVPSLMELALRSAYKSADLNELPDFIPDSMDNLRALLERAADQRETGGLRCSDCRKSFVAPTTQWLEWWQVCLVESRKRPTETSSTVSARPWTDLDEENHGAVPFLRRGCSWKCGPADLLEGQWSIRPSDNNKSE
ncbi:Leucine-rich repeat-containing protein 57 [Colletotrichum chlorophyti]|uniref:Leucine-rich repeat-containing protein 57 n=1 Tax=Colletotrichum chlorophyti TaxID=708187 RepID=A0A1Q8S5I2_9PEZI|nr:Leucine-rich repeat-containing protein 57 [Colletotrichum chlorophyti]